MLSKCTHSAGVGLASLPEAKVSAASKKLKSSGTKGWGMGHRGRKARRNRAAVRPTETTAKPRLRASLVETFSIRRKKPEAKCGQPKPTAIPIKVRLTSIVIIPALAWWRSGVGIAAKAGHRLFTQKKSSATALPYLSAEPSRSLMAPRQIADPCKGFVAGVAVTHVRSTCAPHQHAEIAIFPGVQFGSFKTARTGYSSARSVRSVQVQSCKSLHFSA